MQKLIALACVLLAVSAHAELQVGDVAPNFSLPGSDGNQHVLEDMRGQYVVVAFFPKAYTSG